MHTNGHTNGIIRELNERTPGITETVLRAGRKQARALAQSLSRKGLLAAKAHLCNEAVLRLIELCFEQEEDGSPANVDPESARILIGLPWGEKGHRAYGLRSTEQRVLRRYLMALQNRQNHAPLFIYDPSARSWYLNIWDGYTSPAPALAYWQRCGLTAGRYRRLLAGDGT